VHRINHRRDLEMGQHSAHISHRQDRQSDDHESRSPELSVKRTLFCFVAATNNPDFLAADQQLLAIFAQPPAIALFLAF